MKQGQKICIVFLNLLIIKHRFYIQQRFRGILFLPVELYVIRCINIISGSREIRRNTEGTIRRRSPFLAAQASPTGFLVVLVARSAEPQPEPDDPGGRG